MVVVGVVAVVAAAHGVVPPAIVHDDQMVKASRSSRMRVDSYAWGEKGWSLASGLAFPQVTGFDRHWEFEVLEVWCPGGDSDSILDYNSRHD